MSRTPIRQFRLPLRTSMVIAVTTILGLGVLIGSKVPPANAGQKAQPRGIAR